MSGDVQLICIPSSSRNVMSLPDEALLYVLSYLDYRDLISCCLVCRRLKLVSEDALIWKKLAVHHFLVDEFPQNVLGKDYFIQLYSKYGEYIHCYRKIRKAWDKIENYLVKYLPELKETLRKPATESELALAERKIGAKLPADLRCSLNIHNGQKIGPGNGLMGSMSISSHFVTEKLLDSTTIADNFQTAGENRGCSPITHCWQSHVYQFIAITEEGGFDVGEIFYLCPDNTNLVHMDQFISARNYTEWLTKYAQEIEDKIYPKMNGKIYKFYQEPSCLAVTDNIFSVRVATCFMPELSTVNPPHYFFTYRITMSMAADAPYDKSCQLNTRHWVITDENGLEEAVIGPGVVGEFPVMTPGAEFSWVSCTTFSTEYGNIVGRFTMKNLKTGKETTIACPCFHMRCLPYKTSKDRFEKVMKKRNP